MQSLVWLNGEIVPLDQAKVSIDDRGFVFADGVYEVLRLYDGQPFALDLHFDRLAQGCAALRLSLTIDRDTLERDMRTLIDRSGVRDGSLYLQLTRGVAPRNPIFPANTSPTLLFYARPLPPIVSPDRADGQKLWTVQDERWRKCWIKAIGLTAAILAKNESSDHGADEAAFVDDADIVAECSSSNLFIVTRSGELVTHPVGPRVLPGITRYVVLECARSIGLPVAERMFTLQDAKRCGELFITSTTRQIAWVSTWDDVRLHDCVGPITMKLHDAFERYRHRYFSMHGHLAPRMR